MTYDELVEKIAEELRLTYALSDEASDRIAGDANLGLTNREHIAGVPWADMPEPRKLKWREMAKAAMRVIDGELNILGFPTPRGGT